MAEIQANTRQVDYNGATITEPDYDIDGKDVSIRYSEDKLTCWITIQGEI